MECFTIKPEAPVLMSTSYSCQSFLIKGRNWQVNSVFMKDQIADVINNEYYSKKRKLKKIFKYWELFEKDFQNSQWHTKHFFYWSINDSNIPIFHFFSKKCVARVTCQSCFCLIMFISILHIRLISIYHTLNDKGC